MSALFDFFLHDHLLYILTVEHVCAISGDFQSEFSERCRGILMSFSSSYSVQLQRSEGSDTFSACWVILMFQ